VIVLVLVVVGVVASMEVLVVVFGGVKLVTGSVLDDDIGGVIEGPEREVEEVFVPVGVVVGLAAGGAGTEGVGTVVAPLIGDLVDVEGGAGIL